MSLKIITQQHSHAPALATYPTPITSPIRPKAIVHDSCSPQTSIHSYNTPVDNIAHIVKKRKTCTPNKSITRPCSDAEKAGIVKLEVFALYSTLPKSLLYHTKLINNIQPNAFANLYPNSCVEKKNSGGGYFGANADKDSVTSVAKSALMPIDESIDYSIYNDTSNAPLLEKKGTPLNLSPEMPSYYDLTLEELKTCATLRMYPAQYLHVKKTMITAVHSRDFFNKRDAQVWFRMDVNKTCLLYDWFKSVGWIPSKENWRQ